MLFNISLYISLAICAIGIMYRMGKWFRISIGPETEAIGFRTRLASAVGDIFGALFSRRIVALVRTLIFDVLLQLHILKSGFLRWFMHMSLFYGFLLLVLLHVFDKTITAAIFPGYVSTLAPYFFMRSFLGAMVLVGLIIAAVRRFAMPGLRRITVSADLFLIMILTVVVSSGILLEACQIISEPLFDEMVVDYWGTEDEEEIAPLKALWEREYAVVFAQPAESDDPQFLETGRLLNAENCAACHSRPVSAFMSHPVALAIKPIAGWLNEKRADWVLWRIHFLATFFGLACLPFTKLFHMIATPISLLARKPFSEDEATKTGASGLAGRANRRALGLDACAHCGICSLHCRVAPVFRIIPNPTILPSEKLVALRKKETDPEIPDDALAMFSEGSFVCTDCGRCSEVCPSGIDLRDMWQASKQDLEKEGRPEPYRVLMGRNATDWAKSPDKSEQTLEIRFQDIVNLTDQPQTFAGCVQCTICTTVCPVVGMSDDPAGELDLTPQQIMNLLRLEMKNTALGARMVWKCVTCYMCQEHCPQGVRVADILYELRNTAYRRW